MPKIALDRIAWRILDRLQHDARVSNADLARDVGLSPSPCLRRVRELEQSGIIKDYVTLLEPADVGLPISVFVQVTLEQSLLYQLIWEVLSISNELQHHVRNLVHFLL